MLIYNINNTEIDQKYVSSKTRTSTEKININARELIAATKEIELINTDPTVFGTNYAGSLFYGVSWYNAPVTIYDDEDEQYIWKGRIKNITENTKEKTITVTTTNFVRDMADTVCVLSSSANITPAEHVYNILTDLLGIDDSYINYSGFQNAINVQAANTAYVQMEFTKEKNKSCLTVIQELCRMCQMHIFTINNIIYLYQWQGYTGQIGYEISAGNLVEASYSEYFEDENIYNDYKVYYKSGAAVAASTGNDASSISTYGITKTFSVPNEDVGTVAAEFTILFLNISAATWAGALAIERYKDIKKRCELTLSRNLAFLQLNDQIDLNFTPFIREPVAIVEIKNNDNIKSIIGEFLNLPVEYYSRDITAPDPVELQGIDISDRSLRVRFSKSLEADHAGYKIYFTSTPGVWDQEICSLGQSPIDVKNPSTIGGDCYADLFQLNNGTTYYFKIKSYDTSFNESEDSNVLNGVPAV